MKLQLQSVFAATLLGATLIAGCKKEMKTPDEKLDTSKLTAINGNQFIYYTLGTDITEADLIATPGDQAQERFNKIDLALTYGLLALYKDRPAIIQNMVTKANNTTNKLYNLLTYSNENPQINPVFDSVFSSKFQDFATYGSWKNYVQANYHYDTTYVPFVRFANIDTISFNAEPYIAAPLEIVNEQNFPSFENEIPLWVKTTSGIKLTTVNEVSVNNLGNPILIVANGFNGDEMQVNVRSIKPSMLPPAVQPITCFILSHVHEGIQHQNFSINHRYDRSANSEYAVVWDACSQYDPSDGTWWEALEGGAFKKDVHKSNMGQWISMDVPIFYPELFDNPLCFDIVVMPTALYDRFAIGMYEYDWYAGLKKIYTVVKPAAAGGFMEEKGWRKFYNEWYYFDPNTNNSYPFVPRHPSPNTLYPNYSSKGNIHLNRQYF